MAADQTTTPKPHWNEVTPRRLLIVLMVVIFLFPLYFHPKGWPVLIATAYVAAGTFYLGYKIIAAFLAGRPYQNSIRSLLLLTPIIAFICYWITLSVQKAAKQEVALGKWDKTLEYCFFEDVSNETTLDFSERSGATDDDLEYIKEFTNPRMLYLSSPKITDAGLKLLKDLKGLYTLNIKDVNITDAGLEELKELDSLRSLSLINTRVKGAGLKHLKLDQLHFFSFQGNTISDDGWEIIKTFNHLDELCLENTGASDERLTFLKDLKNLRRLNLSGNPITDATLANVKEMKSLHCLLLNQTDITDAGLEQIKELGSLGVLHLNNTKITAAGLQYLEDLNALTYLSLDCATTRADILKLQKALPQCMINR